MVAGDPFAGASGALVFTYGTLEIPEVVEALTGRRFPWREASLQGYARFLLRGRVYPAVVPSPGDAVAGRVYGGVDPRSLRVLDVFEDEIYQRLRLPVRAAGGSRLETWVWVLRSGHHGLLGREPWDRGRFAERHLSDFLRACRELRDELARDPARLGSGWRES
jgi:gamma-glutamylcyclotransferase (GGCT)/AIG2-like uncharacterized protein YtfP